MCRSSEPSSGQFAFPFDRRGLGIFVWGCPAWKPRSYCSGLASSWTLDRLGRAFHLTTLESHALRREWPLGYRLLGHALELVIPAAWLAGAMVVTLDHAFAEMDGLSDPPDLVVGVILFAPVAGIVSWLLRYVGPARNRDQRRMVAAVGLAACVAAWVVALVFAGRHDT